MSDRPPSVELSHLLPDRPIGVKMPTTVGPFAAGGMFLLLFAIACIVWSLLGVDLVKDWRLARDTAPAADAGIDEARCRSWLYVFTLCTVSATDRDGGAEAKHVFRYAFVGRAAGTPVTLVREAAGARRLSTDLGIARLWGRTLALGLIGLVLVGATAAVASVVHTANRTRQAFAGLDRQRLVTEMVEVERHNALPPRRRVWVYLYRDGAAVERAMVEWPSRDRPIFITKDERWALAVRGPAGTAPLLLDGNLKSLDLSQSEKVAFFEACRAQLDKQGLI